MSWGPVYLYLNDPAHAETWVNGGTIPIFPAQKYKSDLRGGIFTPDENLLQTLTGNVSQITREDDGYINIGNFIQFAPGSVESIMFDGCQYSDESQTITLNGSARSLPFDCHILCFSDKISLRLMKRLNKVCAVKICKIEMLNNIISKQVREIGVLGKIQYTRSLNRNLFLKSNQDEWQSEVRIAWPFLGSEPVYVNLPPKMAKHIRFE